MKWVIVILVLLALITAGALIKAKQIPWADLRRWVVSLWQRIDWNRIVVAAGNVLQWLRETGTSIVRRPMLFISFLKRQWPKIVGGFLGAIALLVALGQFLKRMPPRIRGKLEGPFIYVTFLLVRFLAKHYIFFFAMEEGTMAITKRGAVFEKGPKTGKKITRRGAFQKAFIQWQGRTLSQKAGVDADRNSIDKWDVMLDGTVVYDVAPDGSLVNGEEQREPYHPYGSFRFFLWPLEHPHLYEFTWTNVDVQGRIQPHEPEVLDYVYAREDLYFAELFEVEDADGLHLYVSFLVRMRVINPKKALFDIENWLEAVLNRVRTLMRGYIGGQRYRELYTQKTQAEENLWKELEGTLRIEEFHKEYGVEVPEGGIDFIEIEPPEGYRPTTLLEWEAKQRMAGTLVDADAERERYRRVGWRGILRKIAYNIGERILR